MKLHTIQTGLFKLDGGAMFGVVPKSMWQKLNPPDANNMCTWSMRCLLIEVGNRLILVDTGMGNKQDEKFRSHFHPHGDDSLELSLKAKSFSKEDITDVIFTHLHFDHCGGAVERTADGKLQPTFPNAKYWSNEAHWNWALTPNDREKASFLKENFVPISERGQLQFIDESTSIIPEISMQFVYGHTEAMMLPYIQYRDTKIVFAADLMPSSFHLPSPYVMAYDIRPLHTLVEKEKMLTEIVDQNYVLFFEHDPIDDCARLKRNEQGRIVVDTKGKLEDLV